MLIVLERECLDLGGTIEHLSEKQDLLATLKESKMSLQTVAPEKLQEKMLKERGQKKHWSYWDVRTNWKMKGIGKGCYKGYGAVWGRRRFFLDSSSFGSCSAKCKERDWWSADLEGEIEKLEVEGGFFWDRRRIRGS